MTFLLKRIGQGTLLLTVCLAVNGCFPGAQTVSDEEKEPYFLEGKNRVVAMDFDGAIQSFENALAANPKSAAAHFELGCLYDQRKAEPATAIYHYGRFLDAHGSGEKSDRARTRILACKQELAKTVSLAPVTQNLQHEFDQLTEDNRRLREEVERWRAYYLRTAGQTNPPAGRVAEQPSIPVVPVVVTRNPQGSPSHPAETAVVQPTPAHASSAAASTKTHTVKGGETPSAIARKYNIKVETLMALNPRVDARHLQVGQALNIPAQ